MYDYIIVGGGIYGLLLACKLSREKNKIMLVDKKDIIKSNKLNYMVITQNSYNLLNSITDNIDEFITKKLDSVLINNQEYHTKRYILNIKKLKEKLIELCKKNKVKIIDKTSIDKYNFKNNEIVINSKKYNYKYLIGADGTLSEVKMNKVRSIQRFKVSVMLKSKNSNDYKVLYNQKNRLYEECTSTRNNNLIRIISNKKKNNLFNELENIKSNYSITSKSINTYLIPNGDLLIKSDNVYFIGDAAGIINPLTNLTMDYNLDLINKIPNINNKDIKRIKRKIKFNMIVSILIYLPIINKLVLILIKKICKEDIC